MGVLPPRAPGLAAAVTSCRTLASVAHTERRAQQQSVLTSIKPSMPDQQRFLVEVAGDGGVSTWLGTPATAVFSTKMTFGTLCVCAMIWL